DRPYSGTPPREGVGPSLILAQGAFFKSLIQSDSFRYPNLAPSYATARPMRWTCRRSDATRRTRTAPIAPFSLGHGNAAGAQGVFRRAGRGPGQRGQRSSGKSQLKNLIELAGGSADYRGTAVSVRRKTNKPASLIVYT